MLYQTLIINHALLIEHVIQQQTLRWIADDDDDDVGVAMTELICLIIQLDFLLLNPIHVALHIIRGTMLLWKTAF